MRVGVLGRPAVWSEGAPCALVGARQAGLLALLVARVGHVVPAATLEDELWAGTPVSDAALRVAVRRLRARWLELTGDDPIEGDARGYRLDLDPVDVDASAFASSVEAGRRARQAGRARDAVHLLAAADALWRGPAYAGVDHMASTRLERDRLDALRLAGMEERAIALLALDDLTGAIEACARIGALDPFRESAWGLQVIALARAGRQRDALAALTQVRRLLAEELGLRPSPALTDLERAILEETPPAELRWPGVELRPEARLTSALVGRDDVLAQAVAARDAARDRLGLLVVEGEPGSGKTAVLEQLARQGRSLGGRADRTGTIPLRALLEALGPVIGPAGGDSGAALAQLLEAPGAAPAGPDDLGTHRHRLVGLVRDLLADVAADVDVVVLDDAQWLDPLSLAVLDALLDADGGPPLLVALGLRTGEAPALDALLADRGHDVPVTRVALGPLDRGQIAALVGLADGDELAAVVAGSGGNPRYALQLARAPQDAPASVPADLRRLCRARLDRLSPPVREALEAASVLVGLVTASDVAALLGADRRAVAARLDSARAAGLLEEAGRPDHLRFVHGVLRQEAYEGVDAPVRAALHRTAARVAGTAHAEVALHMARAWPLAASDEELGAAALRAGLQAMNLGAGEAAAHFFGVVTDLAAPGREPRAEALLGLGVELLDRGEDTRSRAAIDEALVEARRLGRWDLVADSTIARQHSLVAGSRPEGLAARGEIDEVLAHIPAEDDRRRGLLLCWRADLQVNMAPAEAAADLEQARLHAAAAGDARLDALLRFVDLRRRDALGEPAAELLGATSAAYRRAREDGARHDTAMVGTLHAGALLRVGRGDEASATLDEVRRAVGANGAVATVADLLALGVALGARPIDEVEAANEAVVASDEAAVALATLGRVLNLTVVRREQGRLRELEPLLLATLEVSPRRHPRPLVAAARAEDDDLDGARAQLEVFASEVGALAQDWSLLVTAATAAEVAAELGHPALAHPLRPLLAPWAGEVVTGFGGVVVMGRVDRYLGLLAHLTGDLDGAVGHLATAAALDAACGLPLWAAWAQADEAAVRIERGGPGDAGAATELLTQAAVASERMCSRRLADAVARLRDRT